MTLSTILPWILIGVAGVVGLYIMYSLTRTDEDAYEDDEEIETGSTLKMSGSHAADTQELPETDAMQARKSRMIALKDSLERSLQTRSGVKASGLDRLAMPWFMLVGTEGSGKKSLLASTGLPLPYGPPVEVDSARRDAGRWWLFEDAVVVEAPSARPAPKSAAPSEVTAAEPAVQLDSSEGWNNLLHLLRRERPDSPLNGIIISVSCADLVGTRRKSPEEVAEQAGLIRAFLDRSRRVLGVRLPVHLLITRCDVLPGFRSFAETLPEARRDDIFGWANPHSLEKTFDVNWIDKGFAEVQKSLESLHDELLAAPERIQDADGLFVFVSEFAEIQDPLVDFVRRLMPEGERRPSLFFRGVYFTGDASETAAKAASRVDEDAATLHISIEAAEAEAHSLVFLRSLFADKIFKEAGLARTAAKLRISRDMRVVLAQAAAVLIALLGGVGLWTSLYGFQTEKTVYKAGLRTEASDLSRVLSGVAIDLDQLKHSAPAHGPDSVFQRRATDAALVSVVDEMQSVTASRLRSAFVPSSWLSSLPKNIKASIVSGVQDLVLPVMRTRLQERIDRLIVAKQIEDLDTSDPKSLAGYLAEVGILNRNLARYNALANKDSGRVRDIAALTEYLFGERLTDTTDSNKEFETALRTAAAPPLTLTLAQERAVVTRATALVSSVADSATRQLSSRPISSRADADLAALRRLYALVQLSDPVTGLSANSPDSTPSGVKLAKAMQDSIQRYIKQAGVRVLRDTLSADQAGPRLRSVLTGLFAVPLLQEAEVHAIGEEIPAGYTLRWDIGKLEVASGLVGESKSAMITVGEAFPAAVKARLADAIKSQLRDRMVDMSATAQRFVLDTAPKKLTDAIASATENIDAAQPRLTRIARLLDSLGAGAEARKMLAVEAQEAEHTLALAQANVDSARYLAPHPTVVASWRGGLPVGFAALGVADSGAFGITIRDMMPVVPNIGRSLAPALAYLHSPAVKSSMIHSPKLIADWTAIGIADSLYRASDFGSSVFALQEFIRQTMGSLDLASCQAVVRGGDTLKASPDWFTARRRELRATMLGRCGAGTADAAAAYQRLRSVFTAKLAGHFPFVEASKASTAPDADPAAVREFYALYDAYARSNDIALRSDPRAGPGARQAFTFLDLVAQARPFLAPFIDSSSSRKSPEYNFILLPAPGMAGMRFHTGTRVVTMDDSLHTGVWGFGEGVRIDAGPDADPAAAKKTFASTGWWSLVELATLQQNARIRFYHPDSNIELKLPTFPTVAPDLPNPR